MPGRNLNNQERRLKERWDANFGPSLRAIEIHEAPLRGLTNVTVDFRYPLTVLAGKNGVGKSTLLACAACAYKGTDAFATYFLQKKYFNFADFFATGWGEIPARDVIISWTYRDPKKIVSIRKAQKGPSRWFGYRDRPERAVEFVGTVRALHPCELSVLRQRFCCTTPPVPNNLDEKHRASVSTILSRNYQEVQLSSSGRYTLHHLRADETQYSAFNAGSGEDIACCLSRIFNRLPKGALVVIEELEMGLHPAAQRSLIQHLLSLCFSQKVQVICSTHSATVLESVPSEARVLLVRHGTMLQPRYEITVGEAVSDLSDRPVKELAIYVEDEVARALVQEALPAQTRTRVRIITCGSWQDVIRFLATFHKDRALGHAIGILDGDREAKNSEHEDTFKKLLGGTIEEQQKEWLRSRLHVLPGGVSPEAWLWGLSSEPRFCAALSLQAQTDVNSVNGFFAAPAAQDHHGLAYRFSQRIGTDEDRALLALVSAAVQLQADWLGSLITFVDSHLNRAG